MAGRRLRHARTARQRAQLHNAQLASARKRKRNRRIAVASGVAVVGAVGVASRVAYTHNDKKKNVYLYHNTTVKNARSIKRHGFVGATDHLRYKDKGTLQRVYFSEGRNRAKMYGKATVRVKVPKAKFPSISQKDPMLLHRDLPFYTIHEKDLKGLRVARTRIDPVGAKRRVRNVQYKIDDLRWKAKTRKRAR